MGLEDQLSTIFYYYSHDGEAKAALDTQFQSSLPLVCFPLRSSFLWFQLRYLPQTPSVEYTLISLRLFYTTFQDIAVLQITQDHRNTKTAIYCKTCFKILLFLAGKNWWWLSYAEANPATNNKVKLFPRVPCLIARSQGQSLYLHYACATRSKQLPVWSWRSTNNSKLFEGVVALEVRLKKKKKKKITANKLWEEFTVNNGWYP